ncbi:hypothetical protein DFP72DRAFT_176553 [Ephemerocybe angulata]|uniref:F-box domain-containing protein n=1 Tax=Ephemerocybe angulata TaxID=980116 RepID=A0A8H6MA79_9AGAR|nr:hypothetical protein DFP72DRAFT_176553 [Tulosesus angulatus]
MDRINGIANSWTESQNTVNGDKGLNCLKVGIASLPVEVLGPIFLLAHASAYESRPVPLNRAELAMAAVCRQWRNLALSFTALWSTFRCIKPACDSVQQMKRERKRLELYLKRSGNSGLDLEFEFNALPPKSALWKTWAPLLNCAIKHAHRWARFAIKSDGVAPRLYLVPLEALQAPRLESLEIHAGTWDDWQWQTQYNRTRIFASWETLSENQFGPPQAASPLQLRLDISAAALSLPSLQSLVHFNLEPGVATAHPVNTYPIFLLVIQLPTIESISVWCEDQTTSVQSIHGLANANDFRPVHANRLRHLRVGGDATTTYCSAFGLVAQRLIAPRLESLTIQGAQLGYIVASNDHHANALPHPGYSFPSLHTLHLINISFLRELLVWDSYPSLFSTLIARTRNASALTFMMQPGVFRPLDPNLRLEIQGYATDIHRHRLCPTARILTLDAPSGIFKPSDPFGLEYWSNIDQLLLPPPTRTAPWPSQEQLERVGRNVTVLARTVLGHKRWPPIDCNSWGGGICS